MFLAQRYFRDKCIVMVTMGHDCHDNKSIRRHIFDYIFRHIFHLMKYDVCFYFQIKVLSMCSILTCIEENIIKPASGLIIFVFLPFLKYFFIKCKFIKFCVCLYFICSKLLVAPSRNKDCANY